MCNTLCCRTSCHNPPQLFPLPSPALSLAATSQKEKVPWTAQCTCQTGEWRRKEGRNLSRLSSFPGNILFSSGRIQRKPGLPLLLPQENLYPHPFALWHPKAKKEYLGVPRLLRNQPDPLSLVPSSSAFPCETISCGSKLLLHNPNSVPATILLDF